MFVSLVAFEDAVKEGTRGERDWRVGREGKGREGKRKDEPREIAAASRSSVVW